MSGAARSLGPAGRTAWHLQRDGAVLVLSRRLPARFDLSAATVLQAGAYPVSRGRLAHQIRQDVWRCLQNLRGFRPVVQITHDAAAGALHVIAGGALPTRTASAARSKAETLLADLLADPARRSRWLRHARSRKPLEQSA